MKEELEKLESDKAETEAKLRNAEHAVWSLKVDVAAIQKKIDKTKKLMDIPVLKRTSDPPPPATTSSPQIRTGVKPD